MKAKDMRDRSTSSRLLGGLEHVWTDGAQNRVQFDYECDYEGDVNIGTRELNAEILPGTLWVSGLRGAAYGK